MQDDPYSNAWRPKQPIAREKEIHELHKLVFKEQRNVYLHGSKGIGKTFICKALSETNPDKVLHIGLRNRLGESIAEHFGMFGVWEERMPVIRPKLMSAIVEGSCVIFDDVQNLKREEEFFNFIYDLYESLIDNRRFTIIIVGQESGKTFIDSMINSQKKKEKEKGKEKEKDAKKKRMRASVDSRFNFAPLPIPPLDKVEITKVLEQRYLTKYGGENVPALVHGALSFISMHTYQHDSDIRLALQLLNSVDLLAKEKNEGRYTKEIAEDVWTLEKTRWAKDDLLMLHIHQSILLSIVAAQVKPISTSELFDLYDKFMQSKGGHPLDYRQILRHLDILEKDGYITIARALPPRSNTITIHESLNPENIVVASKEIDWESMVLGARMY